MLNLMKSLMAEYTNMKLFSILVSNLQEGDIVFIESQSSQSPFIKIGTMSKWTHCGVVGMPYDLQFKFDNGKMYCSELVWLIS